jgi:hypothetical protein
MRYESKQWAMDPWKTRSPHLTSPHLINNTSCINFINIIIIIEMQLVVSMCDEGVYV